ncbi:MAG TPA: cytochrome c [Verrucomicrobiota bacterium]|nr:cytochrome c [Verrucomicrobiota bacterium]HNU50531.1 cytochrome c [Verrucomicrobiota bacterium]
MRQFLLLLALAAAAVLSIAGFRGSLSRQPPLEVFPDMDRQPRVRPQSASAFFEDGFGSRRAVAGTVAHGALPADAPEATGRVPGSTQYVTLNPKPISAALLDRGRERFEIHCLPCHGARADGKGITTQYGMVVIASLHDPRIVRMPDGEIFDTMRHGRNLMPAYGPTLEPSDRWAVIAYLRALQLSHLGLDADVPAERRAAFPP